MVGDVRIWISWPAARLSTIAVAACVLFVPADLPGAQPAKRQEPVTRDEPLEWLTGTQRIAQLRRSITTNWNDVPLGQVIEQLSRTQRISIFRDRRVDPSVIVRMDVNALSVFEALCQVLDQQGLAGCWIGDIFYIAAPDDAARLLLARQTLRNEIERGGERVRRRWLARIDLDWPRLSVPDDLRRVVLAGIDDSEVEMRLPHDLWPAFGAADVPRFDALLLLVHGFDQDVAFDKGGEIRLLATPRETDELRELREYRLETDRVPAGRRREILELIVSEFPEATFNPSADSTEVRAVAADILTIQMLADRLSFAGTKVAPGDEEGKKVVSLRTRASIGQVLATAARNLGVELQYPPELREALDRQVELDVSRVTWRELIETALRETDLDWELDERVLAVRSRNERDK